MSDTDRLTEAVAADVVPPPPAGLAQRVAGALAGESGRRRPRWFWPRRALPLLAAVAGGVVLGILWMRAGSQQSIVAGERRPSVQETIHLGSRAVLVAEAGAVLRWRGESGNAVVVEQSSGDVFYRVNGGPFLVETPFGVARVRGTCFRVEVTKMKLPDRPNVSGMAVGVALGVAMVVTVYEGKVLLARSGGEIDLGPGQSGAVSAGGAPQRVAQPAERGGKPMAGVPRFDETQSLRARVAEQERELARLRSSSEANGKVRDERSRFVDPSHEELLARVERCEVRFDSPVPALSLNEEQRRKWGLSDTERDAMNEVQQEIRNGVVAELRRLYAEMSGDRAMADRLDPGAIQAEIFAKAPGGVAARARQQLARERAGLAAPPADPGQRPVAERTLRLMAGAGDEFERKLAERIGAERAHSLRARNDGWPNKTSNMGCDGEPSRGSRE
jgi:hypothetical protein